MCLDFDEIAQLIIVDEIITSSRQKPSKAAIPKTCQLRDSPVSATPDCQFKNNNERVSILVTVGSYNTKILSLWVNTGWFHC